MTLDPWRVREAADIYVEEHGAEKAIELLQRRLPNRDTQEQNAVLEAIGYVRRNYAVGHELADVEAAK